MKSKEQILNRTVDHIGSLSGKRGGCLLECVHVCACMCVHVHVCAYAMYMCVQGGHVGRARP